MQLSTPAQQQELWQAVSPGAPCAHVVYAPFQFHGPPGNAEHSASVIVWHMVDTGEDAY
jgi:hypothetical protein